MSALLIGLAAAGSIAACAGSGNGNSITVVNGSIALFRVRSVTNQDTASVLLGNTAQMTGTAYDASFNALALVGDTVWVSRDPATATVNAHGLVTTKAVGNTWVIGTFTPKNSTASFTDSVYVMVIGPQ